MARRARASRRHLAAAVPQQVRLHKRYGPADFRWQSRFIDMISPIVPEKNLRFVDHAKIDQYETTDSAPQRKSVVALSYHHAPAGAAQQMRRRYRSEEGKHGSLPSTPPRADGA